MIKYEYHALSRYFPMLPESEFEELKNSIKRFGLLEPITLFDGKILDGRNRYAACRQVGVEPRFRNYEPNEHGPLDFVVAANMRRRHLTEAQKAQIIIDIEGIPKPLSKKESGALAGKAITALPAQRGYKGVAQKAGVSIPTIAAVVEVQDFEDIKSDLREGKLTAREAAREAERRAIEKGEKVQPQKDPWKAAPAVKETITNLRWIIKQDWGSGLEQGKVDVKGHIPRIIGYVDNAINVLEHLRAKLQEAWHE